MQICQQNSSTDNNRTVGRRVPNDVHVYKHDTTLAQIFNDIIFRGKIHFYNCLRVGYFKDDGLSNPNEPHIFTLMVFIRFCELTQSSAISTKIKLHVQLILIKLHFRESSLSLFFKGNSSLNSISRYKNKTRILDLHVNMYYSY